MGDYCPGAVQVPQAGGVTLDRSLPPRFVWHITWDALKPDGTQPGFSAVANYLIGKEYCPHIMWNPFTGYMEQYYPADVGGRALAYNNQDGAACVQIEVFFTPGCVVDGVKYATVADTPLNGLETLLAWGDSLGVPRTWPLGSPQWQGNSRDAAVWNTQAGHYGHCHSPGDTHTDPGPMPDISAGTLNYSAAIITELKEIDMDADQEKRVTDAIYANGDRIINTLRDVVNAVPGTILNTDIPRGGMGGSTNLAALVSWNDAHVNAVVEAIGKTSPGTDLEAIRAAIKDGLAAGVKVDATVTVDGAK